MSSTKDLLETISTNCLDQLTVYKYSKSLKISEKYKKGKITAMEYILDLIYHFYEKDALLKKEFEAMLSSQIEEMSLLKDGDYKKGLTEALEWAKSQTHLK